MEAIQQHHELLDLREPFKSADKKVHDHDHLTGEYRGPAHKACNLNYRIDPKKARIPCIIHNLEGIVSML